MHGVNANVYHSVDATLLTGGVGWGGGRPVQKDRENDETNVSRPAVWKDMLFLSRRDHVGTNQMSTLGKRGIYRVLSKNGWIWIHLFWSILGFPRRAQQSFSIGIYSVFSMSSFQTCKNARVFSDPAWCLWILFEHISHESRHLYNKLNNPFEIGMSFS